MACPTANMDDCTKKCKCVGGACAGLAYDCSNPCGPGIEFNPATCECDDAATTFGLDYTSYTPGYSFSCDDCIVGTAFSGTRTFSAGGYLATLGGYLSHDSANTQCPSGTPTQINCDVTLSTLGIGAYFDGLAWVTDQNQSVGCGTIDRIIVYLTLQETGSFNSIFFPAGTKIGVQVVGAISGNVNDKCYQVQLLVVDSIYTL